MPNRVNKFMPNCLRKYRKAAGFKQKEVARILGLRSASVISRWENSICLPKLSSAFKLAVLYRTMVDALFIDLRALLKDEIHKNEQENKRFENKPCP